MNIKRRQQQKNQYNLQYDQIIAFFTIFVFLPSNSYILIIKINIIKFYSLKNISNRNSRTLSIHIKMVSIVFLFLILFITLEKGEAFVQIIPQFDASNIGPNVVIRDAILINSQQKLIISYKNNVGQYISKYSVQAGGLVLQLNLPSLALNPAGFPITVLCANQLQNLVMVFTGQDQSLYLLNANTFNVISSTSSFFAISQMIWSPVNNNIYIVDSNGGQFGYLTSKTWNSNYIFSFGPPSGTLRMSVSPNYIYMAVSITSQQQIYVFKMVNNILWATPTLTGSNCIAHQWLDDNILYAMPVSTGYLAEYDIAAGIVNQYSCFSNGAYNIFSFHMHKLIDSSIQYIIGSSSGTEITFLQLNFSSLSIVNSIKNSYSQNLVQLKYSTVSPQKGLLIFSSFVDTIDILEQCQNGYVLDLSSNKCIISGATTTTSLSVLQQQALTNIISISTSSNFIQSCNYMPGNRKLLQPFFIFFVNLDDIQLYIYHQRQYDFVLGNLLSSIQILQSQKWSTIQFEQLWGFFGVNTTFIKDNFDSKIDYTSWKFLQVQGNSSGFMINTLNLFLSNVFLIFLMFLIFRTAFFILFKYEISKTLRQYSFWPYLYFMMIDGNLQFLSYMYLCELQHFFSPNFSNKCGLVFMIGIFLVLILLISCSHLLLRQTYGILAKYFFENTKTSIQASIYLILQFGYRNFILGVVHALFNHSYTFKISLLLIVQIFFLMNGLFFLSKRDFFSNQTRIAVNSIAAFFRICMIFSFIIGTEEQIQVSETTALSIILEKLHLIIVVIYLLLGTFSTFYQIFKMIYEVLYFLRDKQNKIQQNKVKKVEFSQNQKIRTIRLISKQLEKQKLCIFQELQFKQNIIVDAQQIQCQKEETTVKNKKKVIFKKQFNKSLKIKQTKQNQSIKEVQSITLTQMKQI